MPAPTRSSPRARLMHATALMVALATAAVIPAVAAPQNQRLTVVELFTSQGCSSCPPADANLVALSRRPDVLALSFSVTYWDHLGWRDTFGKPEFTKRQYAYEPQLGERGPFTPQMVVNGRISRVGFNLAEIERTISAAAPLSGPDIALGPREVSIDRGAAPPAEADIWLVAYDPNVVEVPVRRGENSGRTLPHVRVVHRLERLGGWDGKPLHIARSETPSGLLTAVLVQLPSGGPILSAVTE
ncbi:DUF1223 domain-containing protein [Xanthobacter oligotrophicus]|uniref:DUF1223 domain-containing protein n=1 Tax=Xanthobacter oligotrophicus TaxID=2607286 RepID=UPI0011F262AB|nr:DUF1223 domain-containing protein [Xanthobacter oligotrophicus]MCG5236531.1 DUF1223 domain-containing protein [Xanthobacter oligotrophicus]